MRDERDEVGAERREAPQFLDPASLGLVGANVLDGARDQPPEQAYELELLALERARFAANERDHPDRLRTLQKGRRDPTPESQLDEFALLRIASVDHVLPVDGLAFPQDVGEKRLAHGLARAAREDHLGADSRDRHHPSRSRLFEDDRHPVERDEPSQLADERLEGRVEVERGAERAGAPCGRLEDVGPPAQLVA